MLLIKLGTATHSNLCQPRKNLWLFPEIGYLESPFIFLFLRIMSLNGGKENLATFLQWFQESHLYALPNNIFFSHSKGFLLCMAKEY